MPVCLAFEDYIYIICFVFYENTISFVVYNIPFFEIFTIMVLLFEKYEKH